MLFKEIKMLSGHIDNIRKKLTLPGSIEIDLPSRVLAHIVFKNSIVLVYDTPIGFTEDINVQTFNLSGDLLWEKRKEIWNGYACPYTGVSSKENFIRLYDYCGFQHFVDPENGIEINRILIK